METRVTEVDEGIHQLATSVAARTRSR